MLTGALKDYTVRKDSWVDTEIAGLPASSYVADFTHKEQPMVDYRIYFLAEENIYWFAFQTEKLHFETSRPELDAILNSFAAK